MEGELTPLKMGNAANQDIFPALKILTSTSCLDLMLLSGHPGELLKLLNYHCYCSVAKSYLTL